MATPDVSASPLACVLWDFGDTLADERWMLAAPADVPESTRVWADVAGVALADRWNRGEISDREIVRAVAARLSLDEQTVRTHTRWCLGRGIAPSESLPIDDTPRSVEAWTARGGRGYLFRGEEPFRSDLGAGLRDLARSAGIERA